MKIALIIFVGLIAFSQVQTPSASAEGLPDLIVEDIIWFPKEPHVAEDLSIQVTIRNVGDAPVKTSFTWKLYIDHREPVGWTYDAKEPLKPGDGWTGFFDIKEEARKWGWGLSEGEHRLRAVVDKENKVAESNEDNNELIKTIRVEPKLTTRRATMTTTTTRGVRGTTTMAIITNVDHPKTVQPEEKFEVTVTVEYSSPYELRVKLWDDALRRDIDEIVDELGWFAGTKTYTFTLTAPTTIGAWKIIAYVFYLPPYYIEEDRTYKHTEPGWVYEITIYVGKAETITTTSRTHEASETTEAMYETSSQYSSTSPMAQTTTSLTSFETAVPVQNLMKHDFRKYALYIATGAAVVAAALLTYLAGEIRSKMRESPKHKKCMSCGAELPIDAEYCDECGAKVD
jgi:hypothetical protein